MKAILLFYVPFIMILFMLIIVLVLFKKYDFEFEVELSAAPPNFRIKLHKKTGKAGKAKGKKS